MIGKRLGESIKTKKMHKCAVCGKLTEEISLIVIKENGTTSRLWVCPQCRTAYFLSK